MAPPPRPVELPDLPDFLTGHIDPLTGFDDSNDGDGSENRAALFGSLAGSPRAAASPGGAAENPFAGKEVSRNAPCPCGSGNKYKHCHGALVLGLGGVTMTFGKFAYLYRDVQLKGLNFVQRFETMYSFLKKDKTTMGVSESVPSSVAFTINDCSPLDDQRFVCAHQGRNYIFENR
jgi:hypothetical protein